MLFRNVGGVDGKTLDFEITAQGAYYAGSDGSVNGVVDRITRVYVQAGTVATLQMCVKHDEEEYLPSSAWRLDFFDVDRHVSTESGDASDYIRVVEPTQNQFVHWTPQGSLVRTLDGVTFSADPGDGPYSQDVTDPSNPYVLSQQQQRRGLSLTFTTPCVKLQLGSSGAAGSTSSVPFFFVASPSMVYPPCLADTSLELRVTHLAGEKSLQRATESPSCTRSLSWSSNSFMLPFDQSAVEYKFQASFPPSSLLQTIELFYSSADQGTFSLGVEHRVIQSVATPYTWNWFSDANIGDYTSPDSVAAAPTRPVYLSPTYLVSDTARRTTRIDGTVLFVDDVMANTAQETGALSVRLFAGIDGDTLPNGVAIAEVYTSSGANFTFEGLDLGPGHYTVQLASTFDGFKIVTPTFNVFLWDEEQFLYVSALAASTSDRNQFSTQFVLSWEYRSHSAFGGFLKWMGKDTDQFPDTCMVYEAEGMKGDLYGTWEGVQGLDACTGAEWAAVDGSQSNVLNVTDWAEDTVYKVYATLPTSSFNRKNCYGERNTLDTFPGVGEGRAEISCMADSESGRGACYSSYDGQNCAPCVLWDPEEGEVLCSTYNYPDGLCDPSIIETCDSPNAIPQPDEYNYARYVAQNTNQGFTTCSGAHSFAQTKLQLIVDGELLSTNYLRAVPGLDDDTVAVRLACVDTFSQPFIELGTGVEQAMTQADFQNDLFSPGCNRDSDTSDNWPEWDCGSSWSCAYRQSTLGDGWERV